MSDIIIKKPDSHKREYSFVELDNGFRAIVASDPTCDKAGAACCVNVGMCHERKDLPGLAHFLEHMLFTGTKKYPREGEYHEFVQQNGGCANAYTLCFFTNYMFEVKPEKLEEALDRFARFFTEPLITRDCTEREIKAVDSEFQGGLTHPWWRYIGIMNQSANPEHPFHVACGNLKVLRDEPIERGIDLYDEMKKLYNECYSANGMTAVVIGRESVEELRTMVKNMFGGVVNKGITMPIGDAVSDKPPFLPEEWNRLLLQFPVMDIKSLTFTWVLQYQDPLWKSKPTNYISHLLGHEGPGSLCAVLKQKGLISGCSSHNGSWLEGAFSLLNVSFDLTEKGLDHTEEIGRHLFAFIGMLQKTPPQHWIYDEIRKLAEIDFKFLADEHPFELCQNTSLAMQCLPPDEVLSGKLLVYDYKPEEIASILNILTVEKVRVQFQAKTLESRCTDKDTSYGSPMKFEPLEENWRSKWNGALIQKGSAEESTEFAASLGIHLPKPNLFIPEDLSLKKLPENPPQLPQALRADPLACIFHRQDDKLLQPKANAKLIIYTPYVCKDIVSFTKSELWCRCVQEALQEYAYDANVAGMSFSISIGPTYIALALEGFNDKFHVLLDAVLDKIKSMREVPENVYRIVADAYSDQIQNAAFHSKPYHQASMRYNELTAKGGVFPSYQRYETFKTLSRESLTGIADDIFYSGGVHVEGLVLGNQTAEDAKGLARRLIQKLDLKKHLTALPEKGEAKMADGTTLWRLDGTDAEEVNHAFVVRMQLPESLENDLYAKLLNKVVGAKFFDVLRTQQQLGYIVSMGALSSAKFVGITGVVQTEFSPDYVRGQVDAFFIEHFQKLLDSSDTEEFETCRGGLASEFKNKHKSLGEEAGRFVGAIVARTYDFDRREKSIDYIENKMSMDGLKNFVKQIQQAPRLYIQVKKTNPKADKELPEGAVVSEVDSSTAVWTTHQESVANFHKVAEWSWVDTSVSPPQIAAAL